MSGYKPTAAIVHGLFLMFLALLMWRATHSYLGWFIMFAIGAPLILWGVAMMIRDTWRGDL